MENGNGEGTLPEGFMAWMLARASRCLTVLGGTKTVAAEAATTQAWPVLGRPSQPVNGSFSQRSFPFHGQFLKCLRAPIARSIPEAPTRSTEDFWEIVSFSQSERPLRTFFRPWAFRCYLNMAGLVSCMPECRSLAAEFFRGALNVENRSALGQKSSELAALNAAYSTCRNHRYHRNFNDWRQFAMVAASRFKTAATGAQRERLAVRQIDLWREHTTIIKCIETLDRSVRLSRTDSGRSRASRSAWLGRLESRSCIHCRTAPVV